MRYYCSDEASDKSIYDDFVRDLRHDNRFPFIHYVQEYDNQEIVKLCCSQHSKVVDLQETISDYERKKITEEWAKFLSSESLPLKEVQFCTITNQKVFDAICRQKSIQSLRIKSFNGTDISAVCNLTNLKHLFIECASSVKDISPLSKLDNLETLILGSTLKVKDYSSLKNLHNLKVFSICSYRTRNDTMQVESDDFIEGMVKLEYLDLRDTKILNRTYLNAESVMNMKYACFPIE